MKIEAHRKNLIRRRLCLALIILAVSVLQNSEPPFPPQICGARTFLLIPVVVCVSMFERDVFGAAFGLFAGALWDVFASGADFNALYLLTVGFACGSLINSIMRNNLVTASILSFSAVLFYVLGYWLFHFVFAGLEGSVRLLLRYYLPDVLYTSALIPPAFFAVRRIEKRFSEE